MTGRLVAAMIVGFVVGHYGLNGLMALDVLRRMPATFSWTAPNGDEYLAIMRPQFRRRVLVYAWVMVGVLAGWLGYGIAVLVGSLI